MRPINIGFLCPELVQFSECGSYLLSKTKFSDSVTVIPIPPDFYADRSNMDDGNRISEPNVSRVETGQQMQFFPNSYLHTNGLESQLRLHTFGSGRMVGDLSASLNTENAVALSSKLSAEGLQLRVSQLDGSGTDIIQIAAMPYWPGSSNSTAELKLPESEGDSAKIIIHKIDATGYGDAQLPMVIERDSKFLSRPRRLLYETMRQTSNGDDNDAEEHEVYGLFPNSPSHSLRGETWDETSEEETLEDRNQAENLPNKRRKISGSSQEHI